MMTGSGTNSYLLGSKDLIVIDPGPDDAEHVGKLAELSAGRLAYILVTHHHPDHAPGAARLAAMTGAPILSFGTVPSSPFVTVVPDRSLADGDVVAVTGLSLMALHTPGHTSDHLSFMARFDEARGAPRVFSAAIPSSAARRSWSLRPTATWSRTWRASNVLLHLSPSADVIAPGHGELIEDPPRRSTTISHVVGHESWACWKHWRVAPQTRGTSRIDLPGPSSRARRRSGHAQCGPTYESSGSEGRARSLAPDDVHAALDLDTPK